MTHITQVLAVPAVGAYYYEDLAALHAAPMSIEERYTASPVTAGFRHVREVAEAVSVGLVLDSGAVAWGDCVAVAYSGKAGRDPVFRTREGIATIRRTVAPALRGEKVTTFHLASDCFGRFIGRSQKVDVSETVYCFTQGSPRALSGSLITSLSPSVMARLERSYVVNAPCTALTC